MVRQRVGMPTKRGATTGRTMKKISNTARKRTAKRAKIASRKRSVNDMKRRRARTGRMRPRLTGNSPGRAKMNRGLEEQEGEGGGRKRRRSCSENKRRGAGSESAHLMLESTGETVY